MVRRWLFHLVCVLALAWPALINGQPFFFPDSTAYVRAGDSAAYIFSGHRIRTEWTERYRRSLEAVGTKDDRESHISPNVNDLGTESVMAGRSPYFGALLWLSYVLSRFWLFVFGQAVVAYALVRISLRLFGLSNPFVIAGVVGLLSLLTSLSFFVSLLMPDLLAGLAILAFMLLAIDRGRLSSIERWGLAALILVSVLAHITHLLIVAAMLLLFMIRGRVRGVRWADHRRLAGVTALILVIGIASLLITSLVVERTFGRKPLLVPLLTARFMADGTGLAYLRQHCPRSGFAACAYKDRSKVIVGLFLWSLEPGQGGYMLADTRQREALSMQDKAFALAVLGAYPVEQGARMLHNGWRQLMRFDIDLFNAKCGGNPRCWSSLPSNERASLMATPGGRDRWPEVSIALVHYATVAAALVLVVFWLMRDQQRDDRSRADLKLWCALLLCALAVNALLGGAVSDPQPRYQARVVWLLPLLAAIATLGRHGRRSFAPRD